MIITKTEYKLTRRGLYISTTEKKIKVKVESRENQHTNGSGES